MKFAKMLIISFVSVVTMMLTGCAPNVALNVPESEVEAFFSPNDEKSGKATIYLMCGKSYYDGWLPLPVREGDHICQYKINGEIYQRIGKDGVGRLNVNPGNFSIKQNGAENALILEMKAGDVALCTASFTAYTGFSSVFVGMAGVSYSYPVECEKENVLVQIKSKKPVRMEKEEVTHNKS